MVVEKVVANGSGLRLIAKIGKMNLPNAFWLLISFATVSDP
jgi:hypothetical protein